MKTVRIGQLGTGEEVFDRIRDPILSVKPPEITQLLPGALARVNSKGEKHITKELPFFSQIGFKQCVKVSSEELENIYYAKIINQPQYSRFVKGRQPESTNKLVVMLTKVDDYYVLNGCYSGDMSYPEPWRKNLLLGSLVWDSDIINKSWSFWKKHAFVEGYKKIRKGTVVKKCPWTKLNPDSAYLKR